MLFYILLYNLLVLIFFFFFYFLYLYLCIFSCVCIPFNLTVHGVDLPYFSLLIISGGQSTQIKYLSKSTDTYTKILLQ